MGQYHVPVNLDKREFIWPHQLGDGLKLLEQLGAEAGVASGLHVLLAASAKGAGGDYEHPVAGRWAGDRIAIIGDYADDSDLEGRFGVEDPPASTIYELCVAQGYAAESKIPEPARFRDITPLVQDALQKILGAVYIAPAHDRNNPTTAWLDVALDYSKGQ